MRSMDVFQSQGDDPTNGPSSMGGFTLIEMLVALSVAAIFVAIAIPSYRSIVEQNSIAANVNEFIGALNTARSEAITRGRTVRLCKSKDGQTCIGSGGWQQGWIILESGSADILRAHDPLSVAATANGARDLIEFDANGFAFGAGADTVLFCSGQSTRGVNVVISFSGRVRSEDAADAC